MLRSPKPPILIVGAGLSGLSLAAILQKSDVPYMVFDSSTRQRTQRHGITLHPWAYSPLLSALDVKLEELRSAVAVDSAIGGSGRVDTAMRDVYTGKILDSEIKALQSQASHHAKPLRAKKSLMRDFLLDKLDTSKLYWDWKLKSIRHGDESVVAEFDNGKTMVGRFLVAADGLHSVGKQRVFPEAKPSITAMTVYNGRRTLSRTAFDNKFGPYMQDTTMLSGSGDGFNFQVNIDAINESEAVISWTYSRDGEASVDPTFQSSQPNPQIASAVVTEMTQIKDLIAPFDSLIQKKDLEGDTIYNWVMRSIRIPLKLLSAASTSRIVLIGDAAHAMPIYEGTGANQAILDSVELGNLLVTLTEGDRHWQGSEPPDVQILLHFYKEAYPRWEASVATAERKLQKSITSLRSSARRGVDLKI